MPRYHRIIEGAGLAALILTLALASPTRASEARDPHPVGWARVPHPRPPEALRVMSGGITVPKQLRQVPTLPETEIENPYDEEETKRRPPAHRLAVVSSNVRANNPTADASNITNSETSIAVRGANAVAAWNDGMNFSDSPGGTGYAYSTDGGLTFTDGGVPPVTGPSARHEGDPVMTADGFGRFYLSDLYTPDGTISAIAVTPGVFGGGSFAWNVPVVVASTTTDFLDKEWVAADPENGNVYVAWTRFISDGGSQIELARSTDHGLTWEAPQVLTDPALESVQGVRVAVGPTHEVQVAYFVYEIASQKNVIRTRRSVALGTAFGLEVTLPAGPSGILSNYGAGPPGFNRGGGIGFPSLAIDRSLGPNRGRVVVTWEETVNFYTDELGAAGVVAETEGNGSSATANPITIGQAVTGLMTNTADQDWFRFSGSAGQTVILYLTSGSPIAGDGFLRLFAGGVSTLNRAAYSYLGSGTGLIVYTLPSTGSYYVRVLAASATTGNYILSTGFDAPTPGDEVARDTRDVVVQSSPDGVTWDARRVANDDPVGFDNTFPEVAIDVAGQVYVDWYDHRGDAANGILTDLYIARSANGSATFLPSVKVNDGAAINWNSVGSNLAPNLGDYSALVADGCTVYANFADGRQGTPDSWVARITEGIHGPSALASAQDAPATACGTAAGFTATVTPPTATGMVQWFDGANPLGAPVALDGVTGLAHVSSASLAVGPHAITADYSGDGCYSASTSTAIAHAVTPGLAGVAFGSDPNPAKHGAQVELTATLTPAAATGTVQFLDGAIPLAAAVPLVAGAATLSIATLAVGSHSITAQYGGDACYGASVSAPLTQVVVADQAPLVTVLSPNGGELLVVGKLADLRWRASDDHQVASVDLAVSVDHGATYQTLATGVANTGGYAWTVVPPGTNTGPAVVYTALLQIIAHDNLGQTAGDASDAPFAIHDPTLNPVTSGPAVTEFALGRVIPNPSFGSTQIEFAVARATDIRLSILDVAGREIAVLVSGSTAVGRHAIAWSGSAAGARTPTGIYFVRYRAAGMTFVRRLAIAR